jgi:hypothetical protein
MLGDSTPIVTCLSVVCHDVAHTARPPVYRGQQISLHRSSLLLLFCGAEPLISDLLVAALNYVM